MTAALTWNDLTFHEAPGARRPVRSQTVTLPRPQAAPFFQRIAEAIEPSMERARPVEAEGREPVDVVAVLVRAFEQGLTAGAEEAMAAGLNEHSFARTPPAAR